MLLQNFNSSEVSNFYTGYPRSPPYETDPTMTISSSRPADDDMTPQAKGVPPDDSHGKELFANCYDGVFWRQHLNKLGDDVPEEWEPCVSLIRNLCAVGPEDRMTASDALKHEFLHNIQSETRRR